MTYHDNDVYFYLSEGYSLISGSYTITSFSITKGQDPDNHIKDGYIANCDSTGKMTFVLGRSGTEPVAKWFNGLVPPSQTTFNHTAGDLNFAFLGTLELTITGGILGGSPHRFIFRNVALAQGHSGAGNNWWFGGQNCFYIQAEQVIGKGANPKGKTVFFVFRRGGSGNAVNEILVTPNSLGIATV